MIRWTLTLCYLSILSANAQTPPIEWVEASQRAKQSLKESYKTGPTYEPEWVKAYWAATKQNVMALGLDRAAAIEATRQVLGSDRSIQEPCKDAHHGGPYQQTAEQSTPTPGNQAQESYETGADEEPECAVKPNMERALNEAYEQAKQALNTPSEPNDFGGSEPGVPSKDPTTTPTDRPEVGGVPKTPDSAVPATLSIGFDNTGAYQEQPLRPSGHSRVEFASEPAPATLSAGPAVTPAMASSWPATPNENVTIVQEVLNEKVLRREITPEQANSLFEQLVPILRSEPDIEQALELAQQSLNVDKTESPTVTKLPANDKSQLQATGPQDSPSSAWNPPGLWAVTSGGAIGQSEYVPNTKESQTIPLTKDTKQEDSIDVPMAAAAINDSIPLAAGILLETSSSAPSSTISTSLQGSSKPLVKSRLERLIASVGGAKNAQLVTLSGLRQPNSESARTPSESPGFVGETGLLLAKLGESQQKPFDRAAWIAGIAFASTFLAGFGVVWFRRRKNTKRHRLF